MFCDFPKNKHLKQTIYRGPGGTGSASSEVDTTEFQEFLVQAQAAKEAAEAARDAALAAETNAETAETNAETAETNAEAAASAAASSASAAATSASNAATSASEAAASAAVVNPANIVYNTNTYANPSWLTSLAWSKVTGTPTTIAGYGIANAYTKTEVDSSLALKADDSTVVKLTGAQTVAGIKTFSSAPVMAVTGLTGDIAAARITTALNAAGSAPIYACRTWVNFNGTGTVAIRASGNVSSITDNGVGSYTVNFSTAMPDANYSVTVTSVLTSNYPVLGTGTPGTGSFSIAIANQTASAQTAADSSSVYAAIFR